MGLLCVFVTKTHSRPIIKQDLGQYCLHIEENLIEVEVPPKLSCRNQ